MTATEASRAGKTAIQKTRKRVLTRRGVLWLGQTCNQRCFFCYFVKRIADTDHPEHDFMDLDKARRICYVLRKKYRNTAVDIQGGEPTIYPGILDLVEYCRGIGLYPTLITNGIILDKPGEVQRYKQAGLRDFLVSLHGVGKYHDEAVGVRGAHKRIAKALDSMREANIPIRLNCTMTKGVASTIPGVAEKAIEYGARAVNYIAYNFFSDQDTGTDAPDGAARHAEITPYLTEAIDMLEEAGIEANVRYMPLCQAEARHRKNFYDHQQLSYDTHEWDFQSWLWSAIRPQVMKGGGVSPWFRLGPGVHHLHCTDAIAMRERAEQSPIRFAMKFGLQRTLAASKQRFLGREAVYRDHARMRAHHYCFYDHTPACSRCAVREICDGFHTGYVQRFGDGEATPIEDMPLVDNPKFFIQDQDKFVEPEDASWAL